MRLSSKKNIYWLSSRLVISDDNPPLLFIYRDRDSPQPSKWQSANRPPFLSCFVTGDFSDNRIYRLFLKDCEVSDIKNRHERHINLMVDKKHTTNIRPLAQPRSYTLSQPRTYIHTVQKVIDFPLCCGENVILGGIVLVVVSRFPLLFMLYRGNFDYFLDSVRTVYCRAGWCSILLFFLHNE